MIIENIEGKDKGLPNWRIRIEVSGNKIAISTKNFEMGFSSGEWWDQLGFTKNGSDKYETWISVITKDKSKLEGYRPLIIEKLHEILEYNKKVYKRIINRIDDYDNYLNSGIFKDKLRDDKINTILNEKL